MVHIPVLLRESIEGLALHEGATYFDGTLGGAGHAWYAYQSVGGALTVLGCDKDEAAILRAQEQFKQAGNTPHFFHGSFEHITSYLKDVDMDGVDAILLDLGVSSFQIDEEPRGFSFMRDEPLLMTMKASVHEDDFTARDILNTWKEETIADIIYAYGEERYARRIAKAIVLARAIKPFETTQDLVQVIMDAVPFVYKKGRLHPATRTFQALRIVVNDELGSITRGLTACFEALHHGGRLAVISFHSLEDRIVKHAFKEFAEKDGNGDTHAMVITKKPIEPSEEEIRTNPRSRSAKLRILQKK